MFDNARRNAPCVLFFDEVDALGHRRSALSGELCASFYQVGIADVVSRWFGRSLTLPFANDIPS